MGWREKGGRPLSNTVQESNNDFQKSQSVSEEGAPAGCGGRTSLFYEKEKQGLVKEKVRNIPKGKNCKTKLQSRTIHKTARIYNEEEERWSVIEMKKQKLRGEGRKY